MTAVFRVVARTSWPWLIFLALGLLQTHQAFFSPVAVILGGADQPDWTGTMWTYWWTWKALLSGMDPTVASYNLVPVGLEPVAQYNLLDALLIGWLVPAVGPTRGYNLCGLVLLVLAGWTGMAMCRRLGVQKWPAVCAGLLLQTSTMVTLEVTGGRLSQALLPFAGLAFVGLLRITRQQTTRREAVWTGVCTAGAALVYWYAALFITIGALPAAVRGIRRWKSLLVALVSCLLLCLPAVFALAGHGSNLAGMERVPVSWMADESWTFGRYGLGMALSQAYQPAWPVWTAPDSYQSRIVAPLLLALAAIGAWLGPRRWTRPLVGAAVVGWLMTLGPWLKTPSGQPLPIPLPWLAFDAFLPYFDRLWWPGRFELVVVLSAVPLAAFGLQEITERTSTRVASVGFAVLFGLQLLLARPYHPIPASPPRTFDAALYAKIDGPILTAPVMAPFPDIRFVQWLQVLHEQPITGGLGEHLPNHLPQQWEDHVEANGLLSTLRDANTERLTQRVVTPADVADLQAAGLEWAVVDAAVLARERPEAWLLRYRAILTSVWGKPDVETPGGLAWRIEPIAKTVRIPDQGQPPVLAAPDSFSTGRKKRAGH